MVVLVDLDDEATDPPIDQVTLRDPRGILYRGSVVASLPQVDVPDKDGNANRSNPNLNGFSAALGCYPIVSQLASLLDLNSLDNLSRTCRQFRANLIQYRNQLIHQTLRCSNDDVIPGALAVEQNRDSHQGGAGSINEASNAGATSNAFLRGARQLLGARMTNGKIGRCARDMVGECRRCGTVVCRNCTAKSLPTQLLLERHRRLCKRCTQVPMAELLARPMSERPSTPPQSPDFTDIRMTTFPQRVLWLRVYDGAAGSSSSSPLSSTDHLPASKALPAKSVSSLPSTPISSGAESSNSPNLATKTPKPAPFTALAFARTPCNCPTDFYLCQTCGITLRSDDITYLRGWTWRTRYSAYLGGLGTGIGEGNEGVPCGRGADCADARCVEQEVDLDAEGLEELRCEWERTDWNPSGVSGVATTGDGVGGYSSDASLTSSGSMNASTAPTSAPSSSDGHSVPSRPPLNPSSSSSSRTWQGGSWNVQECEGIGGVMRKKVKKVVRIGAVVREFEDERGEAGPDRVMKREQRGERRSWCAWCERVIPGAKDLTPNGNAS